MTLKITALGRTNCETAQRNEARHGRNRFGIIKTK